MTTAELISSIATPDRIKAYMAEESIPVQADADANLRLVVREFRNMKQGQAAAALINLTEGTIQPDALTNALKILDPDHKVGERHGPHYLSKARTGSLKGARFIPGTKRGSAQPVATPGSAISQSDLDEALKLAEENEARATAAEALMAEAATALAALQARVDALESGIRSAKKLGDAKALLNESTEA